MKKKQQPTRDGVPRHQTSINSNPALRDVDARQGTFRDATPNCSLVRVTAAGG
jgi:hypothetical protein